METETCRTCFAEVKSENMSSHQGWHEDIRDFIQSTSRGWN